MNEWRSVVVLSGGVGGARLVQGLAEILPPHALAVVVNTGDDFVHWGLTICPDLDTVMYTLAGLNSEERGWGLVGESFAALAMMERYGESAWFQLGDHDLATHLVRSQHLAAGQSLTSITASLCRSLDVDTRLLPMADMPRSTRIHTGTHGVLPFQTWFVRERCRPPVNAISFTGTTTPTDAVLEAIAGAELIIICPSNPYVSIDPIITLDGVRDALAKKLVVAVSPIIAGRAVKGPLATMIESLTERQPSAAAVAAHYGGLVRGMVVHHGDEDETPQAGNAVWPIDILMPDRAARARVARETLVFARSLM